MKKSRIAEFEDELCALIDRYKDDSWDEVALRPSEIAKILRYQADVCLPKGE